MRVAVSGPKRAATVSKLEDIFHNLAIKPEFVNEIYPEIDYAAVTYKEVGGKGNIAFDGCVLDVLKDYSGEGYNDVIEQMVINSLLMLDKVVVVTIDMTPAQLSMYKGFASLFPDKFAFIRTDADLEVSMR